MNINLTKFAVEFSESGNLRFRMNTVEREKFDEYDTFYVISKPEIPFMLDCMMGKAPFYPMFYDGLYHIRVMPDGFYVTEHKTDVYTQWYFYLPLKELTELHTVIRDFHNNPIEYTLDLTPMIPDWKVKYHNRVKWNYHHAMKGEFQGEYRSNWVEWIEYNLIERVLTDCKRNPELKRNLTSLTRIANNYSTFGETVTVNLSFDDMHYDCRVNPNKPANYYFWIMRGSDRIMNGGIIAHKRGDDNNPTYEYSMHT